MIGEKLKLLRKQNQKTQENVANDLSIQKQTYQNYELEKRQPDIDMIIQLADYYHVTVDYLIGHEVPYIIDKGLFNNEQLDVIERLKTLDKEQCKLIATYIDGLKDGKKR